jgi:hypothetical protein
MKTSKLSLIALCLSILALMLCFYLLFSERRFDADWGQIITGILSFLVTILIAWQIWTVIDTKDIVKELREENENLLFNIQNDAHNQAAAVYSTMFNFYRIDGTKIFEFFSNGLFAANRFVKAGHYEGANAMIKVMNESFPITGSIRNLEKAQLLRLVGELEINSDISKLEGYGELFKNVLSIPSNDNT